MTTNTRTDRIRALNDDLRQHLIGGGTKYHSMSESGTFRTNQPRSRLSAIGLATDKGQPGG